MPNAISKRYTLTNGENTYSSPASVNEADARKLQSLIPALSGDLSRERPAIPFTNDSAFPSRVGFFHQFKHNANGVITTYWFCATATTLYQLVNPGIGQSWSAVVVPQIVSIPNSGPNGGNTIFIVQGNVNGTLPLNGFPVAVNINNTMHLSDGVNSYIFDGNKWVNDGLPIPIVSPVISVITPSGAAIAAAPTGAVRSNGSVNITTTTPHGLFVGQRVAVSTTDPSFNGLFVITATPSISIVSYTQPGLPDATSGGGSINGSGVTILSNRYYWITYSDQSTTHPHESSSSPISFGTGAQTNKQIKVFMVPGTISLVNTNSVVVGSGTNFQQTDVGKVMYSNSIGGVGFVGVIISVQDPQHLTLAAGAPGSISGGFYTIVPDRATHWNLYASSSEEDKIGNLLASIPLNFPFFLDFSPMIGTAGAFFQNVQRPLLNDPPPPTTIMEVHKNRIWRQLPTFPNFFDYTGFEEILAEQAGTPSECVPGADPNTRSPGQINETSYPDQSSTITGLRKHGDALFIGTELNVVPLYGSSLADFQLSEAQAFAVGFAGRRASCSSPFGLAFLSYDLKVYLYPSQYSFGVDSTTALVELGRPKRPEFENIDGADLANVNLVFYNYGRRNWLVLSYRRTDQIFATWVFDFEVKGWFQLQQGYTAVAVFEMTLGKRSLIGAGPDNKTYVIDDLTGNFPVPPNTTYPVGYYRVLLDFTDPGSNFATRNIELEKSNKDMEIDVTIWLDPVDPENPGIGIPIPMTKKKIGANVYSGRPNPSTGSTAQRVLIEFAVAASSQNGTFRGFTAEADKLPASPTL